MQRLTALTLALGLLAGCASPTQDSPFAAVDGGAGDAAQADGDPIASGDGSTPVPGAVGHLTGVVYAPNGTLPIAGALVYVTAQRPGAQPTKVFCDECVKLPASAPKALTDAKGNFDLQPTMTGSQFLVIQKGGFRRIREIYVSKGTEALPGTLTMLPPKTDLTLGDEVPRMTVVRGQYDEIEASLEKLGIDKAALDIVESPLIGKAAKTFLTDATAVSSRQIVFLPCGDFTQPTPNVDLSTDPTIQANLRDFVAAGGRLYVTDWHYDFIARTFPGFINVKGASPTACSGCGKLPYTADADVADKNLGAWLQGQGLGAFTLEKNYTEIASVQANTVTTTQGTKTITPKVWVRGSVNNAPAKPTTVSFEYGCGRVLFSTYHTEPFSLMLTPQEKTLLGVLLEVSVCTASETGVVVN